MPNVDLSFLPDQPKQDLSFLPDKPVNTQKEDLSFLPDQPTNNDLSFLPDQPIQKPNLLDSLIPSAKAAVGTLTSPFQNNQITQPLHNLSDISSGIAKYLTTKQPTPTIPVDTSLRAPTAPELKYHIPAPEQKVNVLDYIKNVPLVGEMAADTLAKADQVVKGGYQNGQANEDLLMNLISYPVIGHALGPVTNAAQGLLKNIGLKLARYFNSEGLAKAFGVTTKAELAPVDLENAVNKGYLSRNEADYYRKQSPEFRQQLIRENLKAGEGVSAQGTIKREPLQASVEPKPFTPSPEPATNTPIAPEPSKPIVFETTTGERVTIEKIKPVEQPKPEARPVGEADVKRVSENILRNNPEISRKDAEAMAKDVIENRQYKPAAPPAPQGKVAPEVSPIEKEPIKQPEEFKASKAAISATAAQRAYMGTSFSPEKRAESAMSGFADEVQSIYEDLKSLAKTDKQKELLIQEMKYFQASYAKSENELLAAHGRIVSPMIAGPSKFPTQRMEKANASWHNKYEAQQEWKDRAINSIKRKLKELKVEEAGGEIEYQKQRIATAEKFQDVMKKSNAIVRKNISDEQKIKELIELTGNKDAGKLLEPDFAGRKGFPNYQLTNNSANIRNMKEHLATLEKRDVRQSGKIDFEGGRIENNSEMDRVQIFFNNKPSPEMISKLKSRAFKWAPSIGAWQRQWTPQAEYAAKEVLGIQTPQSPEIPPVIENAVGETAIKPPELFNTETKAITQRYQDYIKTAKEQGMNTMQSIKYAKDRLAQENINQKPEVTPQPKAKQELFNQGGVQGFGTGKKGEQDLFAGEKIVDISKGKNYNIREEIQKYHPEIKGSDLNESEKAIQETSNFSKNLQINQAQVGYSGQKQSRHIQSQWVGKAISDFVRKGSISLIGEKFEDPVQLATISQILRNPQYETLHFFYIKNNKIILHEAVSSRLPGASSPFIKEENESQFLSRIENTINGLSFKGNDGLYILHNHPNGDIAPSLDDIRTTKWLEVNIKLFKGHIIINHKKFTIIKNGQLPKSYDLSFGKTDKLLMPSKPHNLLDKKISTGNDLIEIGKLLQRKNDTSVVFYLGTSLKVKGIQLIPNELLMARIPAIQRYLQWSARNVGAIGGILVTDNTSAYDASVKLINSKILLDSYHTKQFGTAIERSDARGMTRQEQREHWFGKNINLSGRKVMSPGEQYEPTKKSLLQTARTLKNKALEEYRDAKAAEDEFFNKLGKVNVRYFANREEWKTVPINIKQKISSKNKIFGDLDEKAESTGMTDDELLQKLNNMKLVQKPSSKLSDYFNEARATVEEGKKEGLFKSRIELMNEVRKTITEKKLSTDELKQISTDILGKEEYYRGNTDDLSAFLEAIKDIPITEYTGPERLISNKLKRSIAEISADLKINKNDLEDFKMEVTGKPTTIRMSIEDMQKLQDELLIKQGLDEYLHEWKYAGKMLPTKELGKEFEIAYKKGDFDTAAGLLESYVSTRPIGDIPEIHTVPKAFDRFWKSWGQSGETTLQKMGQSGKDIANMMAKQRRESAIWAGGYISKLDKAEFTKLTPKEDQNLFNVMEGRNSPMNDRVKRIYELLNQARNDIGNKAEQMRILVKDSDGAMYYFHKRGNYFVHYIPALRILKDKTNPITVDVIKNQINLGNAKNIQEATAYVDSYVKYIDSNGNDTKFLAKWVEKGNARTITEARDMIDKFILPTVARRMGVLERGREINLPFYDPSPSRVVPYWIEAATRRLKHIEVFGQLDQKAWALIDKIGQDGFDWTLAKRIYDTAMNRVQSDRQDRQVQIIAQNFSIITKMATSAVVQPSNIANVIAETDLLSTLRGIRSALRKGGREYAVSTGSISRAITKDVTSLGGTSTNEAEHFLKKIGMIPLDQLTRSVASHSGREYALRMFSKIKAGNTDLNVNSKLLNLIPNLDLKTALSRGYLTEEELKEAGYELSTLTIFVPTSDQLPPKWKGDPWIEMLFYLKSFSFNQAKYVWKNIFNIRPKRVDPLRASPQLMEKLWEKAKKQGKEEEFWNTVDYVEIKPEWKERIFKLTRFLIAAMVMGEGIQDVRSLWSTKKRSSNVIARVISNLSSVGMLGYVGDLLENSEYGYDSVLSGVLGPIYSDLVKATYNITQIGRGKPRGLEKQIYEYMPAFMPTPLKPYVAIATRLAKPYIFPAQQKKEEKTKPVTLGVTGKPVNLGGTGKPVKFGGSMGHYLSQVYR